MNPSVKTSLLKAQPKYFNISVCKLHSVQEKGSGKCITCYNSVSWQSKRAKICEECWVKRGGLWEIGCYICKENIVGGDYARVCGECAAKDECVVCKKKLYSRDGSDEDGRRIVGKYSIEITIPGKKEEFIDYFNRGSEALKNMSYEEAINLFKKCNDIIPFSMDCNIGVALRELKREKEALTYFDSAIKEEPTWADPYGEKGITLAYLGRWNEAGPALKKAIDLNYNNATVFFSYGKFLEEIQKQPSEAIPYYERTIALNPTKSFLLFNNIGDIYFNQEKYDEAEKAFQMVLKYDKSNFNALAFTGEINFKKQNFEEALKYYLPSLEIKPDNLELNYHMGICYAYLNQLEKAENHFKHALSINPNLTDVSLELARLYKSYGVFAKAIPIYEKLISDDVVTHPAYLDLALCQYMNQQYRDVINNCNKFIEKDTENVPDPYKWMALAAARLNLFEEAESYCKKALELNTQNQKEIFYFVAAAYSLMNDATKAIPNLENAFKAGISTAEAESDSEFNNIRNQSQYKELIIKYKK